MIQRRALAENLGTLNCIAPRSSAINIKVTVKERKAAKRKEKSRVAAQIRRNKESQTLILLQNALPLTLPSPNQMLEKSIVIRIAGQTLFLLNTLDQVLGLDGWRTISLMSDNFLTFFMDSVGQIVYTSPNIQLLLEQYHWSNLIGMSIFDVIDFKSRWPTIGEVVRIRLSTHHTFTNDSVSFLPPSSLQSSSNSQSSNSRAAIASRLNIRNISQTWNNDPSACSLYNVWCSTSLSHTNSQLRLLVLQAVKIKSALFNSIQNPPEPTSRFIISNNSNMPLQRSISCPSMSSSHKAEQLPRESDLLLNNSKCIYRGMITSTHDRFFNFKSASKEFCELIGESPGSLANINFLDIIHMEDTVKVKSFLDLVVENKDNYSWTPVYRIICPNNCQCVIKTLAKQCCTPSSYSLILYHLCIQTSMVCDHFSATSTIGRKATHNSQDNVISKSVKKYIIRPDRENNVFLKRKSDDIKIGVDCDKYPRLVEKTFSNPMALSQPMKSSPNIHIFPTRRECLDKGTSLSREFRQTFSSSIDECKSKTVVCHRSPIKSRFPNKFEYPSIRSPSYSLESYVLTSPGSESTDVPIDDHFVWDFPDNFPEITQLNSWLDEQNQDDMELILPL